MLDEETDKDEESYTSHFEIILKGMDEIGANTVPIKQFLQGLKNGISPYELIKNSSIPIQAQNYLTFTKNSLSRSLPYLASTLCFGREQISPFVFKAITIGVEHNKNATFFKYYLDRHIELDQSSHGNLCEKLVTEIAKREDRCYNETFQGGIGSVQSMIDLMDGIYQRTA